MKRKNRMEKDKLVDNIKRVWENDHAEEVTEAYNKIVEVLKNLDMYSANLVINLVAFQTTQKSILATVEKEKIGGEEDGRMERSGIEGR